MIHPAAEHESYPCADVTVSRMCGKLGPGCTRAGGLAVASVRSFGFIQVLRWFGHISSLGGNALSSLGVAVVRRDDVFGFVD